ncbi:Hypothetical predicted protein, partial [Marmota monax]
ASPHRVPFTGFAPFLFSGWSFRSSNYNQNNIFRSSCPWRLINPRFCEVETAATAFTSSQINQTN